MSDFSQAIVDLGAVRHNLRAVKERVAPHVRVCPAVKANAYGHGTVPVAKACLEAGADALCVAHAFEGMELREAGIDAPVIVMGCSTDDDVRDIVAGRMECAVCTQDFVTVLAQTATDMRMPVGVHIKVDTGMGRIGVHRKDVVRLAKHILNVKGLHIAGVFTHFATSDDSDTSYTKNQIAEFEGVIADLLEAGISVPVAHASNSGAILAYPEADFDAVRPGIMVYGYYPSEKVGRSIDILPALTWKAKIVYVKRCRAGTAISYGCTHVTDKDSVIATVPVGYADGYFRAFSNKGFVAVNGKKAPVVGRVCMDQFMVDVTDVGDVQVGDEVVLVGGGFDYLAADKAAEIAGTISYELLCAIGDRIERVYVNSGEEIG